MARKKSDDAAKAKPKAKTKAAKAKTAEPTTTPSTPAATLSTLSNPSNPAVSAWPMPTTLAEAPVQTRPDGEVTAPVEHMQAGLSTSTSTPAATGPSARKLERLAWEGTVDVRGVFAGPVADTRAQNVSAGGVFVETAHLLEVGDPVVLSFADDDGGRLIVSGRVRWVTPFGRIADPTPGMGIEFVGLDSGKRHKLDALLQRNRS